MRIRILLVILTSAAFYSCTEEPLDAQKIIEKTIDAYGGNRLYASDIQFDFRDIHYRSYTNGGDFSYERIIQSDSLGEIHDVLNNEGFKRTINSEVVELDEIWTGKYSRSVNSVVYFFRIPFNLNDEAVSKSLLSESTIDDQLYYRVQVSFSEDNGGEDFDDSFVYWINQESFIIDYFAYSYSTDEGGKRFRKMINQREINGLQVVDYINYEPKDLSKPIEEYGSYYKADGMKELSHIINRNVVVKYLE